MNGLVVIPILDERNKIIDIVVVKTNKPLVDVWKEVYDIIWNKAGKDKEGNDKEVFSLYDAEKYFPSNMRFLDRDEWDTIHFC